jgi:allantoin racemase
MNTPKTIYVINPNSLQAVTAAIDAALDRFRVQPTVRIECLTLHEGPAGVQTQVEADHLIPKLSAMVDQLEENASAFVIACFSDPGIHSIRERTHKPAIGIGEAAMLTACTLGQRIGVIAVTTTAIRRHLRYFGLMGLQMRLAGERAVGISVADLSDEKRTLKRMIEVGSQLCAEDGADVLVMGCAGMAKLRDELEQAVGVPVIEPCQAATGMALGRVLSNW